MATKLQSFLQGFRLVTGDALNQMINAINNLTGCQPVRSQRGG